MENGSGTLQMATLNLQQEIPLDDSWDVVVLGGGPAGSAAAIAAAREGARTLLAEATGCLGGMATAGLLAAWCPFSDGEKIIYRGIAEKVFTASKAGIPHVRPDALDWVRLDPEALKRIWDDMVTASGASVLFHTRCCAVQTDGRGTVTAVLLANKAGLTAVRAKTYVDCTGDGDVCAWAGAQFEMGAEGTGELQPCTHCFMISNVDEYALNYGLAQPFGNHHESPIFKMRDSGRYPLVRDYHFITLLVGPATVCHNTGHLWITDPTDPQHLSKAMMHGRKLVKQLYDGMKKFSPAAYANAYLAASGELMGVRESRRIIGDYVLTLDDYLARRSFDDEIARNSYPIDIHNTPDEADDFRAGKKGAMERFENYKKGESHGIPFRSLIPKGLHNVLVAGRCISTDRSVQGSTRIMPCCMAVGEAAGMAAAMADDGLVRSVDPGKLRGKLRENGAYLPNSK